MSDINKASMYNYLLLLSLACLIILLPFCNHYVWLHKYLFTLWSYGAPLFTCIALLTLLLHMLAHCLYAKVSSSDYYMQHPPSYKKEKKQWCATLANDLAFCLFFLTGLWQSHHMFLLCFALLLAFCFCGAF